MGGRGPAPKPAALRQRRNKVATRATLPAETETAKRVPPPLPSRGRRKWHAMTVAWWEDLWRSPMAAEFVQADIHGLYILAELEDAFWREPTIALAAEIRLQRTAFGLTPIDRRRLQWEIESGSAVKQSSSPPSPRALSKGDPRQVLRMVR